MSLTIPSPLPAAGTRVDVPLSTERDCTWSAQTAASWLTVSPGSGQGDASLTIVARENPQGRSRSATIDINTQQFTVVQSAQPCRFEVTPAALTVPHQGGRATIRVTTLEGCSWTTQPSQPWVRVVVGSGGDASATVELAIDSNSGGERSAVLNIANAVVAINQPAGPDDRSECRYSIEPGGITVPAAGGNASFRVSTMSQCAWTATSNQPWIRVVSQNAMGPGDVQYHVDVNTSSNNRSGVISVGTRRHVVTQQGAPRP